jgi:hypothetical protein
MSTQIPKRWGISTIDGQTSVSQKKHLVFTVDKILYPLLGIKVSTN